MPALFTTASILPKWSSAAWIIFRALPHAATNSVQISATPPFCSINCLVCCAGVAELPSPPSDAPISATMTFAPAAAIMIAISRPMPPPAPVTTATLPSIMPATIFPYKAKPTGGYYAGRGGL